MVAALAILVAVVGLAALASRATTLREARAAQARTVLRRRRRGLDLSPEDARLAARLEAALAEQSVRAEDTTFGALRHPLSPELAHWMMRPIERTDPR